MAMASIWSMTSGIIRQPPLRSAFQCLHLNPQRSPLTQLALPMRSTAPFSTTSPQLERELRGHELERKLRNKQDKRIKYIRYTLYHPQLPRPLRFSRNRFLRHWTIHRAHQLHKRQQAALQQQDLSNLYNSMRDACEHLRVMDNDGMVGGREVGGVALLVSAAGQGVDEAGVEKGRLFRIAMSKAGIWAGVPVEFSRAQTEYPRASGWDSAWKR